MLKLNLMSKDQLAMQGSKQINQYQQASFAYGVDQQQKTAEGFAIEFVLMTGRNLVKMIKKFCVSCNKREATVKVTGNRVICEHCNTLRKKAIKRK